eukprot:3114878-Lingulodinium_polyedra.AAC.1
MQTQFETARGSNAARPRAHAAARICWSTAVSERTRDFESAILNTPRQTRQRMLHHALIAEIAGFEPPCTRIGATALFGSLRAACCRTAERASTL